MAPEGEEGVCHRPGICSPRHLAPRRRRSMDQEWDGIAHTWDRHSKSSISVEAGVARISISWLDRQDQGEHRWNRQTCLWDCLPVQARAFPSIPHHLEGSSSVVEEEAGAMESSHHWVANHSVKTTAWSLTHLKPHRLRQPIPAVPPTPTLRQRNHLCR